MSKSTKFTNAILIIGIISSILVFLGTIAGSDFYAIGRRGAFFYGSISIAVMLAIILFTFKPDLKNRVVLLLLSIGICIYSTEIVLEIFDASTEKKPGWLQRIEAAKEANIPFDTRTRFQALMDLREKDDNIYYAAGPSAFTRSNGYFDMEARIHPMGSISNRTLLVCNEHGEWLTFLSDRYGFRNPQDVYEKPIDIALIGDSFTEGFCVEDGSDIAGWLRKKTGLNVLNLGYGSNSSLIELASMKEFAAPFKPKVVLMFYYAGNDMESLPTEASSPVLMKYLHKDFTQNLIDKQEIADRAMIKYQKNELFASQEADTKDHVYNREVSWSRIAELVNLRHRLGINDECFFNIPALFKDILLRADNMAKEWGGKFIFVYLTGVEKNLALDRNDLCRSRYYRTQREEIFPFLKKLGIEFIDVDEVLNNHPDPYSLYTFFYHSHHNADGYKLIAEKVIEHLTENDLVSLPQQ